MKIIVYSLIINLFCWFCLSLSAGNVYTVSSVPNVHLQNAANYVTNPDGIISQTAETQINAQIAEIESATTAEIAVVLLSSIGDDDIDDFGTRLFTQWGIGKKNDNGLLFLLVYDNKEMIFRTGYGLEGVLPDVILSRVIRNDISPLLRTGDFDGGITTGIAKVCSYLKNPEAVQEIMQKEEVEKKAQTSRLWWGYLGISVIIALAFFFYLISKTGLKITNYEKYKSLVKQRGVVIGFTLFFPVLMILYAILYFFVLKRLRTHPIACSKCGDKMTRLSEATEDAYLTHAQQTEESVGSIDYDVWRCDQCGNTETLAFEKASAYSICPYCKAKTFYLAQDRIVRNATSLSAGQGERIYTCKNCNKIMTRPFTIPQIIITPPSRGFGSGGGFGGGGFGGGSWGGGSTGGGGARGGW
jgi:uncharacterized protein